MNFAHLLYKERKHQKLKQSELAKLTGLKVAAISHFETGRRLPSLSNLVKLANALNVSTDSLMGRSPSLIQDCPHLERLLKSVNQLSAKDLEILIDYGDLRK